MEDSEGQMLLVPNWPDFEDPALDNDEAEPTQHSLSVSGLAFTTKREAVRKVLKKFGKVVTVRRFVQGAPRRADVSFASSDDMKAALEGMEGVEIEGKPVKVKVTP